MPGPKSHRAIYQGLPDRAKWFADRLLRRAARWIKPLARHAPVSSVRVREVEGPMFVRLGTSDWVVLEEIFKWDAYASLFAQSIGDVGTVLDLGANVGLSVRLWQSRFEKARVIAVEPEAGNLQMLHRNVDAGPNRKGVSVVAACVAGSNRRVWLDDARGHWGVKMRDAGAGAGVPAMTVPEILRAGGCGDGSPIDLLKCDVEGAEAEVFADCAPWIRQVRWLAIELHPPYDKAKLLADLARNGATFHVRHAQDWVGQEVLVLEREKN